MSNPTGTNGLNVRINGSDVNSGADTGVAVSPTTIANANGRPNFQRMKSNSFASGALAMMDVQDAELALELSDGSVYRGKSFGAPGKSVSGECVFQTGGLLYFGVLFPFLLALSCLCSPSIAFFFWLSSLYF